MTETRTLAQNVEAIRAATDTLITATREPHREYAKALIEAVDNAADGDVSLVVMMIITELKRAQTDITKGLAAIMNATNADKPKRPDARTAAEDRILNTPVGSQPGNIPSGYANSMPTKRRDAQTERDLQFLGYDPENPNIPSD